jgi:hypothetical protein
MDPRILKSLLTRTVPVLGNDPTKAPLNKVLWHEGKISATDGSICISYEYPESESVSTQLNKADAKKLIKFLGAKPPTDAQFINNELVFNTKSPYPLESPGVTGHPLLRMPHLFPKSFVNELSVDIRTLLENTPDYGPVLFWFRDGLAEVHSTRWIAGRRSYDTHPLLLDTSMGQLNNEIDAQFPFDSELLRKLLEAMPGKEATLKFGGGHAPLTINSGCASGLISPSKLRVK